MIQWRVIEILQRFQERLGRLGKWLGIFIESAYLSLDRSPLEAGLNVEKKNNVMVPPSRGNRVSLYNGDELEINLRVPLVFSSLPAIGKAYRVLLNRPFSLFHPGSLSIII
jgi:hypothetical protein